MSHGRVGLQRAEKWARTGQKQCRSCRAVELIRELEQPPEQMVLLVPPPGEVREGLAVLVAVVLEAELARQHRNVRQEPADPVVRGVLGVVRTVPVNRQAPMPRPRRQIRTDQHETESATMYITRGGTGSQRLVEASGGNGENNNKTEKIIIKRRK